MKKRGGMVVIMAVMAISAVILTIGISMVSINIAAIKASQDFDIANNLFISTDGCAGEALLQLRRNDEYIGEIITHEDVTCDISVSGINYDRTIIAEATKDTYTRKIEIDVIISPLFTITSWVDQPV